MHYRFVFCRPDTYYRLRRKCLFLSLRTIYEHVECKIYYIQMRLTFVGVLNDQRVFCWTTWRICLVRWIVYCTRCLSLWPRRRPKKIWKNWTLQHNIVFRKVRREWERWSSDIIFYRRPMIREENTTRLAAGSRCRKLCEWRDGDTYVIFIVGPLSSVGLFRTNCSSHFCEHHCH